MLSFLPKFIFPKITDISPSFLIEQKIRLLLMDYDNTMLPYTTDIPSAQLLQWIKDVQSVGIQLCIVSNTHKERVPRFSRAYHVPCVTHASKPGKRGILQAMEQFSTEKENTAFVGDQIFTDILGANRAGVRSIAVKSIDNHNFWLKFRHLFEIPFLAMAHKRRVNP